MSDDQETEATEHVVNHGRRSAMKKITLGVGVLAGLSALPEQWSRPIIGQIVLPAHAATSGSTLHDPCAVELRGGDNKTTTVIIKVTGFVTPPVANLPVTITATPVLSGVTKEAVKANTTTSATGTFEVIMTIGGGPGITSVNVSTSVAGADGVANCVVHTTAAASTNTCSAASVIGLWSAEVSIDPERDPVLALSLGGVANGSNSPETGSWELSPANILTVTIPFHEDGAPGFDTYSGPLGSNCTGWSGRASSTLEGAFGGSRSGTFTATKTT